MKRKKLLSTILASAMVINMVSIVPAQVMSESDTAAFETEAAKGEFDDSEETEVSVEGSEISVDETEESSVEDTEMEAVSEDLAVSEDAVSENEAAADAAPAVTEIPGTTTVKEAYSSKFDYATGFATVAGGVNDRDEFIGTEKHKKVSNASEFAEAIKGAREGKVKIIELTDDINLGYNSFTAEEKTAYRGFISEYKKPSPNKSISTMTELGGFTNPEAQKNGVSSFKISETNGLTIFSKNGNSISYAELNINRNANDIVIRNVHFKNMWQWDDDGTQKAVGWSNLKLNEGHNIWIDHCSFDAAFDGNIDLENGATGISITWCKIGQTPEEAAMPGNAIYDSITFMESLYSEGKLTQGLYKKMRDAGATAENIMQYSAYHDKCHLCGSGDKDCVDYSDTIKDSNGNIRLTLAYNYYRSIGQRLPMIRQGVGHMFNCYIDDSLRQEVLKVPAIASNATSNYKMSRCINARNGASIAADTCVFNGVEQPVIGAEIQGSDLGNMDARYQVFFKNAYNRSLVVNSKVVNSRGTYIGSSWDNNGSNAFTSNFTWKDKSTIGNWAWSSTITNLGDNTKDAIGKIDPYEFEYKYNTEEELPYGYMVMPLEEVETIVPAKAGCGAVTKNETEWCKAYGEVTEAEKAKAEETVKLIAAIGKVEPTEACKAKIDEARKAYDSLREEVKQSVSNVDTLVAAEKAYAEFKAVDDVIKSIAAIGKVELTEACKAKIDAARKAYEELSVELQKQVTNVAVLETAEADYAELEALAEINKAHEAGKGSVSDNIILQAPAKGKVKIADTSVSENNFYLTVAKGAKVQLVGDLNSYALEKAEAKKLIGVNKKGVVAAKKSTGEEYVKILFKADGVDKALNVKVVEPSIISVSDNVVVKKMKASVLVGDSFEIIVKMPIDAEQSVITNKGSLENVECTLGKLEAKSSDGAYHIKGKAVNKGNATVTFMLNGKKVKVTIAAVTKLKR